MRAGLSTIQQTLTPEAASVLNHSIGEAARRNHGQTTPLHVAATLLSSPSGFLRQACIRSHPNSSHPLQCRALELCFSVALERLPTSQTTSSNGCEPPISNALMAALKRAQAHQRRGCPEQQQQPLLAVKVELEQLIISILDDPSVSRVMREASFWSPAVKSTIEQTLTSSPPPTSGGAVVVGGQQLGLGIGEFRPNLNTGLMVPNRDSLYLNPRLQQGQVGGGGGVGSGVVGQQASQRSEEVKRVVDILMRSKKNNPILVGEAEPEGVVKELLRKVENGELCNEGPLKNVHVMSIEKDLILDRNQIPSKIRELGGLIESKTGCSSTGGGGGGVIVDLGDLKWLVEQPPVGFGVQQQQAVSEMGRGAVVEMGKILGRIREGSNGRVWFIGTATCETYLRCQVYHPTMENDWDLQAVPIASRSPLQGMFPRLGTNGIMRPSVDALNPFKSFSTVTPAFPQHVYENSDHTLAGNCCPQCSRSYEQELAELVAEFEKSSSEAKVEATTKTSLPQWLQSAKLHSSDVKTADQSKNKDQELLFKQKSQELQKKWSDKCSTLHPNFHHNLSSERIAPRTPSMTGFCNPNLLVQPPLQPKLQPTRHLGESLQLNSNKVGNQRLEHVGSLPGSPVRTDLVLGQTRAAEATPEQAREEHTKDFLGCISSEPLAKGSMESIKFAKGIDADSFKKLLKGLMEKAWWQPEAASNVATTLTQCKLGNGKRRTGSKGSTWLLFTGPDRVGMKKMASVVSEQVCRSTPTMISLGSRRDDGESNVHVRGKTALDRIVEAVRRSPFSIIMLEDIDEADMLVRGSIKRAMERGRLTDSHGREISLGNIIFILTGNWSPVSLKDSGNRHLLDEKKLASLASGGWQLRLTISEKSAKRRANWLCDEEDRTTRPRREMGSSVSFDLNQAADAEDYRTDGSLNSSDLTIDHEDGLGAIASVPHELANSVDGTIVFKPVDFGSVRCEIKKTITKSFSTIVDDKLSIQVEDDSLEKILGGVWNGQTSLTQWAEKVLVPSFQQLKTRLPTSVLCSSDESKVICLEPDADSDRRSNGDWLPSKIRVMVDGV